MTRPERPDRARSARARPTASNLTVGDPVTMTLLNGTDVTLTWPGIYKKDELAGPFTVSQGLYAQSGADQFDFSVFIKKKAGVSDARGRGRHQARSSPPTRTPRCRAAPQYIDDQAAQIDTFVNLIYGLLFLAVLIAVFGIANTLSLSVLRAHPRARAAASGRGHPAARCGRTVRWESVITALLGAVQGIVIGILLGYAVTLALQRSGPQLLHPADRLR